jgi:hypothetical protein
METPDQKKAKLEFREIILALGELKPEENVSLLFEAREIIRILITYKDSTFENAVRRSVEAWERPAVASPPENAA